MAELMVKKKLNDDRARVHRLYGGGHQTSTYLSRQPPQLATVFQHPA